MNRFTTKAAAGMTLALAMMPMLASADTVSDLQTQIQSLMSQLRGLQSQLHGAMSSTTTGTTTPWGGNGNAFGRRCIELGRDLRVGHRGDDVKEVQQFLKEHPESGFTGTATGFFGELTNKAMKRFAQMTGATTTPTGTVPRGILMKDCVEGMKDGMQGMKPNAGEVRGPVASVTGISFTVTLPMGSTTRTVTTNASTTIKVFVSATSTPTNGTMADITVGKMVNVQGAPQPDGSLLAREIAVHPAGSMMMKMEDNGGIWKPLKKMFDNRGRRSGGDDN